MAMNGTTLADVASVRARIWDAGFRPVPVYNPNSASTPSPGKAPMGRDWGNEARADPPLAVRNPPHPDAMNTGILCDGLRAIDIDIDDANLAARVRARAIDKFGEAPMRYRRDSPRCLLLYRAATGTPRKRVVAGSLGKVEVLGAGQQFVAFGYHPSGGALEWMPHAPGDVAMDSLPAIDETELDRFLREVAAVLGAKVATQADRQHSSSRHGLRADTLQVLTALHSIPNDAAPDWEAWNRMGMAIWAATGGGEAGRSAWHAWSEQHPAYDPAETNARWDHYETSPPSAIGAGTLFHMARSRNEQAPDVSLAEGDKRDIYRDIQGDIKDLRDDVFRLTFFDDIQIVNDAKDFVQGLITEGAASVIYGESNAGKTFWATDLALHISAGRTWNRRRVEQGGVVYCVLEGGIGFRNRVAAWRQEIAGDTPARFAAIESAVNLLSPDADTPKLTLTIKHAAEALEMPVKLVVVDTLSRALSGGNENSPEDMGALVVNMDSIRAATGAHIMFIHHSGKDAAKGARGHSLLRAAIDTEIEVVAEAGTDRKTASVVKQRDLKKGDVFEFTLKTITIAKNIHDEDITTCLVEHSENPNPAAVNRSLSGDAGRALEVLTTLIATSGQTGHDGTPLNVPSVPADWWRERFYASAKPGADAEAKKKAFRRAADRLVECRKVATSNNRVWLVRNAQFNTEA